MAGPGPAPAENKRRRNIDPTPKTVIPGASVSEPPPLPGALLYSSQTREWYATWCRSPQATAFLPTDWQRLHMLAPLVDAYFQRPTSTGMAEIRINEANFGATVLDRARARIVVEPAKPASAPSSGTDPRTRLRAAS